MTNRLTFYFLTIFLCAFFSLTAFCDVQEKKVPGQEEDLKHQMKDLKHQMARMQKQLDELKKKNSEEAKQHNKNLKDIKNKKPGNGSGEGAESDEESLKELRRLAQKQVEKEKPSEPEEEENFKMGGLSLQALNPELSIVGDMTGAYQYHNKTTKRWDYNFRTLDLHFQAYADPYTKFKSAVEIDEDGAELGEGYMTRFGVFKGVNLTVGKFRQQFGVVNRWHKHALDQVDFPMPIKKIFGDEGLNQTGISGEWTMPEFWGASQGLILQVTNGENSRLFSGNNLSTPSCLLRYTNYRDLSKDIYLDFGLSTLLGWNDKWDLAGGGEKKKDLSTRVFGLDFTLLWEPTDNMRYRNIQWHTEAFFLNRDLIAPDDAGTDTINAWGAFTYLQTKVTRTWEVGMRFDFFKPDVKSYAGTVDSESYFVSTDADSYQWQLCPYVTWHQSPFVKVRLEYDHLNGNGTGAVEHTAMLQVIFAVGPHKHDRY